MGILGRAAFVSALLAAALAARSLVDPINQNRRGVAIKGYDPVAYFSHSRAAKGSPQFPHQWMGAAWWFSSAQNRDLFAAGPAKFAPQYGGYCAWAVSNNYTAGIDPQAWRIIDGKLYLNYSRSVQQMWLEDVNQRIAAADRNWPRLHR
ncbi:MAG: YHS domain protein [Armatimonadetes bacterium]|nr:YHS domain protein [Armatimonadota bacterium]